MNKNTKIVIWAVVIVIVIAGIWYSVTQKPAEEGIIEIGAILPLTGKSSSYGEYIKEGMDLAKDEINSHGGINKRNLEVIYEDSQGDTKLAVSAYQKLVDIDGLKILISSLSGPTLGVAPLAEKDKVVLFAVGTAAPKISEAGDFIFRHNLLPQTEAKVLADLIYNKKGYKRIAGIFVNAESGVGYRDEFKKAYEGLGGEITPIEMYEKGLMDFRTYLAKIKASGVKVVLAGSYIEELTYLLKQAKELNLNVQWFSLYVAEGPKLLEDAKEAAEGLIYTHFFDPNSESIKEYQQRFQERYGRKSEFYSALAYDTVMVLNQVIKKCLSLELNICVKNELYNVKNFPGVTGSITIDSNGDTSKEIIIKTVKNGQFVKYEE